MKVLTFSFLFLISAFLIISCGDDRDPRKLPDSGEFSYDYTVTVNGVTCNTGKQVFKTRQEMCEGLKNDELNHHCAEALRKGYFEKDCSELSWE